MLHNLEMPSFLSDDSGPSLHSTPFDPLGELRQSHEKANSNVRPSPRHSIKGSSENSTNHPAEDINGGSLAVNGDMHNDTGLSSMPNGRSSGSSWENRSSRNGSALSINGGTNGAPENGRKSPISQNGLPRTSSAHRNSLGSMNGGAVQSPVPETSGKPTVNGESELSRRIVVPPPISTNPQSTGPLTYTTSILPATPSPTPETPLQSPVPSQHRFSSPPAYLPAASPTPTTTSIQHPGATQLKHRHTLQVPKIGTNRNSIDEGGFSTGRFSPTIAQGMRRGSLSLNRRNTQSIHSNLPHEELVQDEDALRWSEALRQKRASKRRRRDEEDDDRVVVGTKVDKNHVNWVTAYNMLTGIRFTVSRTNAKLDRPLTDADFEARHKFSFDM